MNRPAQCGSVAPPGPLTTIPVGKAPRGCWISAAKRYSTEPPSGPRQSCRGRVASSSACHVAAPLNLLFPDQSTKSRKPDFGKLNGCSRACSGPGPFHETLGPSPSGSATQWCKDNRPGREPAASPDSDATAEHITTAGSPAAGPTQNLVFITDKGMMARTVYYSLLEKLLFEYELEHSSSGSGRSTYCYCFRHTYATAD